MQQESLDAVFRRVKRSSLAWRGSLWQVMPQHVVLREACQAVGCETLKILAIETSRREGSIAACHGATVLEEHRLDPQQRTARVLAPAIQKLLADVGWQAMDLEVVAVTQGPGSFTGLRIGVTTAKTLGYASGAGVMGLNTLEVLAAQLLMGDSASESPHVHDVVLDAHRNQLFTARYRRQEDHLLCELPTHLVDRDTWLEQHPQMAGGLLEGPSSVPQAAMVGQLAAWRLDPDIQWPQDDMSWAKGGATMDVMAMVPRYYRRSAAEEKRDGISPAGL